MLRQLKKYWRTSQTKAWGYTQLAGSGILASASSLNHAITSPSVKEYLDKIDLPTSVIIGLAVLGLVTYAAHGHGED